MTNEVGQNVSIQNVLYGKGWRGRAQQICSLQQRLNQLSEKLASHEQANSTSNGKFFYCNALHCDSYTFDQMKFHLHKI